jgi:hypothetical protein
MDNPDTIATWGTQVTGRKHGVHKSQDKNMGYTSHRTKTGVHKSQDKNMGYTSHRTKTWGTQVTGRKHGVHKSQDENKQNKQKPTQHRKLKR